MAQSEKPKGKGKYKPRQNFFTRQWRWTYFASNGEAIAVSSESYWNRGDCENSITVVQNSKGAPVEWPVGWP